MMRTKTTCLLSILIAAGCGGGNGGSVPDGGGGDAGAIELSLAEYADQLAAATCAQAVGCCAPIELHYQFAFADPPVTDRASCEAYLRGFLDLETFIRPSIEGGRATFDGARAAECVSTLRALSCDEYSARVTFMGDAPLGCRPITGLVAAGGACAAPWECASGYCEGVGASGEGTCAPLPDAGAECPTGQCAEGLHCGPDGTCATRKADGEACTTDGECASNGCSAELGNPGVCNAPSMCDGDLTNDDHEVYGTCSVQDSIDRDLSIDCRLGTSGIWECECASDGVETSCSPGAWDEVGLSGVCEDWGCCGF